MSLIRPTLIATAALALGAAPALAQQAKPTAQGSQRAAASAGMAKSTYMANVTTEFAQIDSNKDGKATAGEVETFRTQVLTRQRQAANRAAFARLDADKNGSLSPQEFAAVVASTPKLNVDPLVKKLDANNDGGLTLSEFQAGAAADFARLDTNKDNVLSPPEARAGNSRR